jgi:hypothetical protein
MVDDNRDNTEDVNITNLAQFNDLTSLSLESLITLGGGLNGSPEIFSNDGALLAVCNPKGAISPHPVTGLCNADCRLPALTALMVVANIHILVLPESSVSHSQTSSVDRYVTTQVPNSKTYSANTSASSASITAPNINIAHKNSISNHTSGGITLLLSPQIAPYVQSTPRVLSAGRGLVVHLRFPNSTQDDPDTYIIGLWYLFSNGQQQTLQKIMGN